MKTRDRVFDTAQKCRSDNRRDPVVWAGGTASVPHAGWAAPREPACWPFGTACLHAATLASCLHASVPAAVACACMRAAAGGRAPLARGTAPPTYGTAALVRGIDAVPHYRSARPSGVGSQLGSAPPFCAIEPVPHPSFRGTARPIGPVQPRCSFVPLPRSQRAGEVYFCKSFSPMYINVKCENKRYILKFFSLIPFQPKLWVSGHPLIFTIPILLNSFTTVTWTHAIAMVWCSEECSMYTFTYFFPTNIGNY